MTLREWSEKAEECLDLVFPIMLAAILLLLVVVIGSVLVAAMVALLLDIGPLAETCEVPQ